VIPGRRSAPNAYEPAVDEWVRAHLFTAGSDLGWSEEAATTGDRPVVGLFDHHIVADGPAPRVIARTAEGAHHDDDEQDQQQ
jgi:hypothetical protein